MVEAAGDAAVIRVDLPASVRRPALPASPISWLTCGAGTIARISRGDRRCVSVGACSQLCDQHRYALAMM